MKYIINITNITLLLSVCAVFPSYASDYQSTIRTWKSYNDVAKWMKDEWEFSSQDASRVANKIRHEGLQVIPAKSAKETFINPQGWCKDAANFAKVALNEIDKKYKAQYIFIKNKQGPPHHWVTGFKKDGKIYVIDFGAGPHWADMMGIHGPYNSLDGYRGFLSNVSLDNFELQSLDWWHGPDTQGNSGTNKRAKTRAKIVLRKFDNNNDGKISHEEAPQPMRNGFQHLDTNGDNYLDEKELVSLPPRG